MSVDAQPSSVKALPTADIEALVVQLRARTKKMLVGLTCVTALLALAIASLAFLAWRKDKAIEKAVEDAAFSQFEERSLTNFDVVTPQVNTIQFLRHGYSITFDTVNYTQEGLSLRGMVGNPTQLWISSLALKFTARPYPYKLRNKWHENYASGGPWAIYWLSDWDIGTGQTTIGLLNAGSSMPFSVTIPNVKQTSDQIQIQVEFTGERYSYYK